MTPNRRGLALVVVGVALVCFWNSPVLVPARLLVVLFHELGHALAAVLTGGEVLAFRVGADESGMVQSVGGSALLTLNAGYLGSLLWGLGLVALTRTPTLARGVAAGLGVLLVAVALGWTRPVVSFGFVWVLVAGSGFLALARFGSPVAAAVLLRVLGVFSMLYALGDVVDDVLLRPGAPSDAAFLAERTGIPALLWGLGWSAVSLAAIGWALPRLR